MMTVWKVEGRNGGWNKYIGNPGEQHLNVVGDYSVGVTKIEAIIQGVENTSIFRKEVNVSKEWHQHESQ